MAETPASIEAQRRRGHEPETASVRWILILTVALLVGIGVSQVIAALILWGYGGALTPGTPVIVESPQADQALRHWKDPDGDLADLTRLQRELLTGYAWVDRDAGVVRIPIDRAMALLAQRDGVVPTQEELEDATQHRHNH